MPAEPASPLNALKPRKTLTAEDIAAMLDEIRSDLTSAVALDYFDRMEHNHQVRFAWWPGQTRDGRKWATEERLANLMPGQTPQEARDVFPWKGAPDNRVRLVDSVIREHNTFQQLALQRKQMRIGPRDLSPDEDPQSMAALWAQVDDYYEDLVKREWRRATAQWADITKEYGCGVLFTGWKTETEAVPREIDAATLTQIVQNAALDVAQQMKARLEEANGGDSETEPELTAEEEYLITQDAAAKLQEMILDDDQREVLAAKVKEMDPEMPLDEARRVAKELRYGEPVTYYAVTITKQVPDFQALTYGVDVLFPPTITRLKDSPHIVHLEWVSEAELRNRILDPHHPYDEAAVNAVLEHPGKALDLSSILGACNSIHWLLSSGSLRNGLDTSALEDANKTRYQIMHVYYRAAAIGNATALYHTVLHGAVNDQALYHECQEHAAGRYPFFESLSQIEVPYLLAAEGYGEQSATEQSEVKIQRDMRGAEASIRIKPPLKVPLQQAGGRVDWRPGVQFPTRQTAGMGVEVMNPGSDPRGSQEVEMTTLDSFNDYWKRGPKVDPEVKQAYRQMIVSHFLSDVAAAKEFTFKLIQQYSPDELRATFANGLPVNLQATREQIQGQVGIELDFDVSELDGTLLDKRMKAISTVLSVDTAGELNRNPLLRALAASLMPSHYKLLVANPSSRAKEETEDEQKIVGDILAGTQFDEQGSYREGVNHALRLQVMQRIFGVQTDEKGQIVQMQPIGANGQPSRAQRLMSEDEDVKGRVLNRLAFHARQLQQQQNAQIGRQMVTPVSES